MSSNLFYKLIPMLRHFKNMNPFKTTFLKDGPADDGNAAALSDLQEISEGSDQGSCDPGELQFNRTNSESDCCDAEEPAGSTGINADEASESEGFLCELQGVRKSQDQLKRGLDVLKINYQRDNMVIMEALHEGKLRYDALEEQLANLTEYYQREIMNLKEEISSIKENNNCGIRETDVHEALEACHTRLLNMELQQQQQQAVQVEMPEDTTAWVVLRKIISVLLIVLTALLVFVSTLSHFVILLKPSGHMLSALLFTILLYMIWKFWDSL